MDEETWRNRVTEIHVAHSFIRLPLYYCTMWRIQNGKWILSLWQWMWRDSDERQALFPSILQQLQLCALREEVREIIMCFFKFSSLPSHSSPSSG